MHDQIIGKLLEAQHQERELQKRERDEKSDHQHKPQPAASANLALQDCERAHLAFLCHARAGRVSNRTRAVDDAPRRPMISMPTTMSG